MHLLWPMQRCGRGYSCIGGPAAGFTSFRRTLGPTLARCHSLAETNGSEANLYRKNAWYYRDYVIRTFNEDRPYDQFIREQLAGDQLSVGHATGFLVAGPHVPTATVGREPSAIRQARADRLDEIVQTVGASMLGMTVSCARCHNHKFDPISIKDYYSLTAIFQGVEFGSRYAELMASDPGLKREGELRYALHQLRQSFKTGSIAWEEDWEGWKELYFPATTTDAIRLTFLSKKVRIEEIELYGPDDPSANLALSSRGTVAKTDDSMTEIRGEVFFANDGIFNTNVWRSTSPPESEEQPWIILQFPEPRLVDRMVISSNKHYFLETDYLSTYTPYGFSITSSKLSAPTELGRNWLPPPKSSSPSKGNRLILPRSNTSTILSINSGKRVSSQVLWGSLSSRW